MTDQELKDLVASLAVDTKEVKLAQKETAKQLLQLKEELLETERILKEQSLETERILKEQLRETERILKEQSQETDRKLRSVGIQLGNISKNQGDVAEEFFVNSLKDTLKIANIDFDMLLTNLGLRTKKINDEFDIILVNSKSVAIIEVKYKVHPNDLEKLPKKIEHFKLLPQYKNYKIYAGLAGFYIPNDVVEKAKEKGYFILQRKGNIIQTYATNLKAA